MVLKKISILLGVLNSILICWIITKNKLYTKRNIHLVLSAIMFIGAIMWGGGILLNKIAIINNAQYMPTDKILINKVGKEVIEDYKHKNVYENPRYPALINRYYFPKISSNVYSIGDLAFMFGIFMALSPVLGIIKCSFKIAKNTINKND
ncbi:hypothetical protein EXN13_00810 [Clostridium botulinum]|nr:hypothetical protein [Clostridium botulinum]